MREKGQLRLHKYIALRMRPHNTQSSTDFRVFPFVLFDPSIATDRRLALYSSNSSEGSVPQDVRDYDSDELCDAELELVLSSMEQRMGIGSDAQCRRMLKAPVEQADRMGHQDNKGARCWDRPPKKQFGNCVVAIQEAITRAVEPSSRVVTETLV